MYAYRITNDINEIYYYKNNEIYYYNHPLFNINKNSLYKVNTFPDTDKIVKHFYYFSEDAFEIAKIILSINNNIKNIFILEYIIDNNEIIDNIVFGNYKKLVRKNYIPDNKLYKIYPNSNKTYPVLEIRLDENSHIKPTGNLYQINNNMLIPNKLNIINKRREYIMYKLYLDHILYDFKVSYPHEDDGLMIISEIEGNIKKIKIPKRYQRIIC